MPRIASSLILLAIASGSLAQTTINFNDSGNCPSGWNDNSGNSGFPDFCCPGSSKISKTGAVCCIGGTAAGETCGGTAITVGSDLAAYTSSVSAALASESGISSQGSIATNVAASITSSAAQNTAVETTNASQAAKSTGSGSGTSTGAAVPAMTACAQMAAVVAGAGLLLL